MRTLFLFTLIFMLSCSSHKNEQVDTLSQSKETSKFLNMTFKDYTEMWQQVQAFENKGLTKSAYELVQKIYQEAKAENNSPQIIKALLYQSKYMMTLEDDSQLKIIRNFEKEIKANQPPTRNILESYLAQLYWQYYKNNRWRFAQRTETTTKVDPNDFRTWDLKTIFKEISLQFDRSLQNKSLLQNLSTQKWADIIDLRKDSQKFRPTLYDLLVHEALNFYQTQENTLPAPAYKFTLDDPVYLSDVKQFINIPVKTKDTLSLQVKALKLYQDYLKFRFNNKNLDALAMADLERLEFVYQNAVFSDKERLYLQSLDRFIQTYQMSDVAALAYHQKALILFKLGNKYVENQQETNRWKKKEAYEICQKAIQKYPKSKGAILCKNLINNIEEKRLNIRIESNVAENRPVLSKLTFQNIDQAQIYIYKLTPEQYFEIETRYNRAAKHQFITGLPMVKKYKLSLPDPQDYQTHSTEKVLEALPNGYYVLLAKTLDNDAWGYSFMQATDVALQRLLQAGKHAQFIVINRNNGKAVPRVKVEMQKLNNHNKPELYKKATSDAKGYVRFPSIDRYYKNFIIKVFYGQGKMAVFADYLHKVYLNDHIKPYGEAFIFTDRSIYRPGQTIYFKTIVLEKEKNRSKILKNISLQATLYDANHQKVQQLNLKTNDFGSDQGQFIIPEQTLTGGYRIEINAPKNKIYSAKTIRVEAYKRPKFEVQFKPVDKSYKINETVTVTGQAKSFAGTNITGAEVTYRVKRRVEMPRWWYWYRPAGFRAEAQEIAHGKVQTNEKGEFTIQFKALPDPSVKPEEHPVFHYEVYAEVTDLNAETHSAVTTVNVGYHSLLASIELPENVTVNKTDTIQIKTTNLNGVAVPAKGQLKIYKLQAPKRVLRRRPWEAPGIQEIIKEKFVELFPHTPYDKTESDFHFYPLGKSYFTTTFDTKNTTKIPFTATDNWPVGKYIAILETKDKNGQKITDKTYFEVNSPKNLIVPDQAYFKAFLSQEQYEPGQKVLLNVGSASRGNIIRVWVEKNHQIIKQYAFLSDAKYHQIHIPVTEKDRGGFAVYYTFNAYNDYVTGKQLIKVPYPSKELQIETMHFRDKLLPGQKEQWRFKIKGPKGEQVSAELLASMYDASLDQFVKHTWKFNPVNYVYYRPAMQLGVANSYGVKQFQVPLNRSHTYFGDTHFAYDHLKWFGFRFGRGNIYIRGVMTKGIDKGAPTTVKEMSMAAPMAESVDHVVETGYAAKKVDADAVSVENKPTGADDNEQALNVAARKNLQETAFFFPQLYTDKQGNVSFGFTVPESLTKWKLQLLAHTPDLDYAYKELFAVTQKDLMVFPNAPRFVREGDQLVLSTKIANLTGKSLTGIAELVLIDAISQQDITDKLLKGKRQVSFTVDAQGNTQVSWTVQIPKYLQAIQYKVMAKAGTQTDGEQNLWPVLSNRMLVTETMPMWVRSNQTKTFVMEKLLHNQSKTLTNHRLTLEITGNPAWYAVQALPYLMEYPYDCSEQTFARYYANALAGHIVYQNPKIKQVFDVWKTLDSDALLSNLEKNQELKSLIIEETPWLRDAQSESEQKKRIALLFDLNKMSYSLNTALQKLKQMQLPDGGFTWFKGGRYSSRYITQHIVAGFGHLQHLQVKIAQKGTDGMLSKAIKYLDAEVLKDYERLQEVAQKQKDPEKFLSEYRTGASQIHYLYARSFYPEQKMRPEVQKAADFYLKQAQKYWLDYRLYTKGLLALVSHRNGDTPIAKAIIRSLDENSIKSEELGMYWKSNTAGWYWHQAPIETQALLIEAFDEIDGDITKIDEMRIWLLKNKQTNAWKTTKQTTEAVYALLLRGSDWLSLEKSVKVQIGNIAINPATMPEIKTEAGTGYFKIAWQGKEIKPEMAKATITKKGKGIAWGGLYWQYFEDLDKITNAKTPVAITKELFIRKFTDTGEKMDKITPETIIKVGDLVRVRVEIKVDRDMEYVHLKDMRASGLEPINVFSGYHWQDGVGYYQSTRDAATNFFINHLRKGVYVFEYDLRANNAGSFSNGITSLQCMYAPEFSSHSKGMHITIR